MTGQTALVSLFGMLLVVAVVVFLWVRRTKRSGWPLGLSIALFLISFLGLAFSGLAGLYTDYLFFAEVGYVQVFWTKTLVRATSYVAGAVAACAIVLGITHLPRRLFSGMNDDDGRRISRTLVWTRIVIVLVVANFCGLAASNLGLQLLTAMRQVSSTAYVDPILATAKVSTSSRIPLSVACWVSWRGPWSAAWR